MFTVANFEAVGRVTDTRSDGSIEERTVELDQASVEMLLKEHAKKLED